MEYVELVEKSDSIHINPRQMEKLLFELSEGEQRKIDVQRKIGLPDSVTKALRSEFEDVVYFNNDRIGIMPDKISNIKELREKRHETDDHVEKDLKLSVKELARIDESRTRSKRGIDQFRGTPETVANRARFLYERGEVECRSIMCMGDNDMVSVALGLTCQAEDITVFDLDKDLLNSINDANNDLNLDIQCVKYDAMNQLYESYRNKFDVAVTDPPYTRKGMSVFIARCIEGIGRENGSVLISFGYSPRSNERALPFQEYLSESGLVIEELVPGFNRYYGASSIGCQSSIYLCRFSPKTRPVIGKGTKGSLYTGMKPHSKHERRQTKIELKNFQSL